MKIGNRITMLVFLIIIQVGVPIHRGITDVLIRRTGIHGTGALPFI